MDAVAQLALMTKAKLVFEQAGTFLSFPVLTPISYAPEKLRFGVVTEDLPTFDEFSRLTNLMPGGPVYQPAEETYLWDVYYDVLQTGQVAAGPAAPAETAAYDQAKSLLYVPGPNGERGSSPTLTAYQQYRDAWLQAVQVYKAAQTTADVSADPAVKARWQATDEPALRRKIEQAASDLAVKGSQAAVEQAEQVVGAYEARNPATPWNEWQSSYIPIIDKIGDPPFVPTAFAPADVIDHDDWPTFTLTTAEIGQLIAQAPAELKQILDPAGTTSNLDSLSFQYRSVILVRPWLRSALFSARFWRLPTSETPLSDGASPPQGRCPAYITGVVLVRNIVIATRQPDGGVAHQPLPHLPPVVGPPAPAPHPPVIHPPPHLPPGVHFHVPTVAAELAPSRPLALQSVARAPALSVLEDSTSSHIQLRALARVDANVFRVLPTAAPVSSTPPPPLVPVVGVAPISRDVSVLAFVCKRLARCPYPDPSLHWPP